MKVLGSMAAAAETSVEKVQSPPVQNELRTPGVTLWVACVLSEKMEETYAVTKQRRRLQPRTPILRVGAAALGTTNAPRSPDHDATRPSLLSQEVETTSTEVDTLLYI